VKLLNVRLYQGRLIEPYALHGLKLRASCSAVYCNRSCLWDCDCVCLWVCYHNNLKLRTSILTKLAF